MFFTEGSRPLGASFPNFNFLQSPTLPPTIPTTDSMTEMPAPSTQSWGKADSFCQTLNKLKAAHWMHKREKKKTKENKKQKTTQKKKYYLLSFLGRECSVRKGMPDLTQHIILLPCTTSVLQQLLALQN